MDPGGSGARKQIAGIRGAWTAGSDSAPWAATSARPAAPQRIDAPMVGGMAEIARVVRRPKLRFLSRRTAGQLAVNGTSMTIALPAFSVTTKWIPPRFSWQKPPKWGGIG